MKKCYLYLILLVLLPACEEKEKTTSQNTDNKNDYAVVAKPGWEGDKLSAEWMQALVTRETKAYLDSISQVERSLTREEREWYDLFKSRQEYWASIRDSLQVPFGNKKINDTIFVLAGYQGVDDAFTYQYQTVCFDLTALHRQYGSAKDSINTNRIDRIFAHEYTHLLSKDWAKLNSLRLASYQDSILWECLYEGLGMYRSMSSKWFPTGDTLSKTSAEAFENLYPIFAERMIEIDTSENLLPSDKRRLHKGLSNGSMKRKWGALPVGVWLAMEAQGDDTNLVKWVEMGPNAIIPLAKKHLEGEHQEEFNQIFD